MYVVNFPADGKFILVSSETSNRKDENSKVVSTSSEIFREPRSLRGLGREIASFVCRDFVSGESLRWKEKNFEIVIILFERNSIKKINLIILKFSGSGNRSDHHGICVVVSCYHRITKPSLSRDH